MGGVDPVGYLLNNGVGNPADNPVNCLLDNGVDSIVGSLLG
jgi:hypothetical protein